MPLPQHAIRYSRPLPLRTFSVVMTCFVKDFFPLHEVIRLRPPPYYVVGFPGGMPWLDAVNLRLATHIYSDLAETLWGAALEPSFVECLR